MAKTPSKIMPELKSFTLKEIRTPSKDMPGVSNLVFTHCSTLHSLINDWMRLTDKGTKICKSISALKIHEFQNGVYPQSLRPLAESLVEALRGLQNITESVAVVNKQLKAIALLQPTSQPIINTWSPQKISQYVDNIYECLIKEYEIKHCITENIAHCRDEYLIEVYVSSYELDIFFDIDESAYLFAEMGLTGVT